MRHARSQPGGFDQSLTKINQPAVKYGLLALQGAVSCWLVLDICVDQAAVWVAAVWVSFSSCWVGCVMRARMCDESWLLQVRQLFVAFTWNLSSDRLVIFVNCIFDRLPSISNICCAWLLVYTVDLCGLCNRVVRLHMSTRHFSMCLTCLCRNGAAAAPAEAPAGAT
jgi:hypothetical protein